MKNDNICVFCGEKLSAYSSTAVSCADTYQSSCKNCAKKLKNLSEEEICRRALKLGFAQRSEKIEARVELLTKAEDYRPACLRCGAKMKFEVVQRLDNTPVGDGIMSLRGFEVLPAYCESCGRYEFYKFDILKNREYILCLIRKDTSGK